MKLDRYKQEAEHELFGMIAGVVVSFIVGCLFVWVVVMGIAFLVGG